ncbi:MAG: DEAD/DEAH box helicase [Chitinivibrionales bacterium]
MGSTLQSTDSSASAELLSRVEFFRNCYTLMPSDGQNHQTFLVTKGGKKKKPRLFCSCSKGSYANCTHGELLRSGFQSILQRHPHPWECIRQHMLWKILAPLAAKYPYPVASVQIAQSGSMVTVRHKSDVPLIEYVSKKGDLKRFICRFGGCGDDDGHTRHHLLERAAGFVLNAIEKEMMKRGSKTSGHATEESVWFRLTYHIYKECDGAAVCVKPQVAPRLKQFELTITHRSKKICSLIVPKRFVPDMLVHLSRLSIDGCENLLYEDTATLLFEIRKGKKKTTVVPVVEIKNCDGSAAIHPIDSDLLFGSMVYVGDCGCFVRLDQESTKLLAARWGETKEVENDELAQFLEMHGDIFSRPVESEGAGQQDLFAPAAPVTNPTYDRLTNLPLIDRFERIDLTPSAMDRDWCYMSVHYRIKDTSVSLEQIIGARKDKQRYLVTGNGLIDTSKLHVAPLIDQPDVVTDDNQIKVSRAGVLQLRQDKSVIINIDGEKKLAARLRELIEFSPVRPLEPLTGCVSVLRPYQTVGVQWLLFLFDNQFGGLLCDDMGLGKTHHIIAFFTALREQRSCTGRFLVVCPTTVMSHWKNLLHTFSPALSVCVYYGVQRSIEDIGDEVDVVVTSYGVMRNDMDSLGQMPFAAAVYDEAQNLKNAQTQASQCAAAINAPIKIGLSGTPIENSLWDLKTLMDLVMPGYLGRDSIFGYRYQEPIELYKDEKVKAQLRRLTAPFILRRTKQNVLDELPEKIEDIRTCELSNQQIRMYQDAIKQREESTVRPLRDQSAAIPYMHIFSLLNKLKQICSHPAVYDKRPEDFESYESGKWELFKELLTESLDSGQKVVVFTQYLDMIRIIERYLEAQEIDSVSLTGSSRNRGKLVERFNNEPGCRVFIGSLQAGGVGIDLTAASVVIHYDRWWNAAKEDQATDRVYRIGQKRGVQVVKLVTEGTLEEKIAAIIEKKKNLADVLQENNENELKQFTRQELLSLLQNTL